MEGLIQSIDEKLSGICANNIDECILPRCCGAGRCFKIHFDSEKHLFDIRQLNEINKNINRHQRKALKDATPPDPAILERAEFILGQPIHEHELVKGDQWLIRKINKAHSIDEIVNLMDIKHKQVHGKFLVKHYKFLKRDI